jgi:hypothetical protein
LNEAHALNTPGDLGGAIPGPVVDNQQFKITDANFLEILLDGQDALGDLGDASFFVISWDDDGKGGHERTSIL